MDGDTISANHRPDGGQHTRGVRSLCPAGDREMEAGIATAEIKIN
jgi:hypothetical protein